MSYLQLAASIVGYMFRQPLKLYFFFRGSKSRPTMRANECKLDSLENIRGSKNSMNIYNRLSIQCE